ncbi:MAG: AMP-binding protein [Acidobacteriota bacterium]|nr:AMP-binding protein [Acidobacteriota bacterium]
MRGSACYGEVRGDNSLTRRDTLLDFFFDFADSSAAFLVHDDGYRTRSYSYREVAHACAAFALRLRAAGIAEGEKVLVWSENRPEWIVALWGCLLAGVIIVPVDYRASAEFLLRVREIVNGRLILVGGDVHPPPGEDVWKLSEIEWPNAAPAIQPAAVTKDSLAEIIFTSGATADPKGVTITHRNVLANIVPVEGEVHKYRKYGRPFFPIRFLNLLPLSHMFGQAMAAFIPPMLPGVVVFMRGYSPREIARQIRTRRISVLVCVPKILDVLREYVIQITPEAAEPLTGKLHWLRRWWRYRRVHQLFGWKFWSFVVGAAALDPQLEEFWSRLGFVVIQGYGLTETAPIVTLNHPFNAAKGTVGKPIAGVEIKISDEGEILVRGENVTSGYFNSGGDGAFEDGWFHTGDIGSMDRDGRLHIRGRKKEMIVTPEGLNVFPEDVERALTGLPGVRDCAVVGVRTGSEERVHAVLIPQPGIAPEQVIRQANAKLQDYQRIRGFSIWRGDALPRTEGTAKLKRREIERWVSEGELPRESAGAGLEPLLARYVRGAVSADTSIADLGLSSLERVELLMALEQKGAIDESAFTGAHTVGDLRKLMEQSPAAASVASDFPQWNRSRLARLLRRFSLPIWILPLARVFAQVRVEGLEHLEFISGPVLFAANHQSLFDGPVILHALPARWRYRVAIAMSKEFFHAHFFPRGHTRVEWFTNSLNYYLASLFFNTFPIPQREAGARETLRYMGNLTDERWSILIFPEGKRTEAGEIAPFQAGVGMIASRLRLPVIPIRLTGLERVLHTRAKFPTRGPAIVRFGPPLRLEGEDYAAMAREVEAAVHALA